MTDISFNCTFCRQHLVAPSVMEGQNIDCPSCGKAIEIPLSQTLTLDVRHRKDNTMDAIDKIEHIHRSANTPQRIAVAMFGALALLTISYGVIDYLAEKHLSAYKFYSSPIGDFDKTWWMWAISLIIIGGFEYAWLKSPSVDKRKGPL